MPAYTGAFIVRDAILKIGGTTYTNQTWRARLVPDTPIQQQRTLVPDGTISDVDSATWTLEISGLQDHQTGGLARYLTDQAGNSVTFEIAPRSGSGKRKASGSVIAINTPFGGDQGEFAQFEIELPVVGAPTFADQA